LSKAQENGKDILPEPCEIPHSDKPSLTVKHQNTNR